MPGFVDRLPMLAEIRGENRPVLRANASDPKKDKNGSCSSMLALDLRFSGVAEYVLNQNVDSFRSQLSEAAQVRDRLFERFDKGEQIDGSYVTMLSYKSLFDALAAGDITTARSLASHMGGRDALEQEHDHPFDYAMGYTLRAFVLYDFEQMQRWPATLLAACAETRMTDFNGYGQVFEAIVANDLMAANEGLKAIVRGHRKQSKGKGVLAGTEDQVLCVWGIGMANIAHSRGLHVQAVPPLIPDDLLNKP